MAYQQSAPESYVVSDANAQIIASSSRFKNFLMISGAFNIIFGIIILSLQSALVAGDSAIYSIVISIIIIGEALKLGLDGVFMILMARKSTYDTKSVMKTFGSALFLAISGTILCGIYLVLLEYICKGCARKYTTINTVELVFFIILAIHSISSLIYIKIEERKTLSSSTPVKYP